MEKNDMEMVQAWLDLQCRMVAGVTRAAVLLNSTCAGEYRPVASWPQDTRVQGPLLVAVQRAIQEHRRILDQSSSASRTCHILACPVFVDGKLAGAFSVEMSERTDQQQRAALQVFTWGTAWLEMLLRNQATAAQSRLAVVVETVAQAVSHDAFDASAMAVVNVLAERLVCQRVTAGFMHGQQLRIAAMSGTASPDARTRFVRSIVAAMHEAVDQDASIHFPGGANDVATLTHAHRSLAACAGGEAACTVPLTHNEQPIGAITLERAAENPFDKDTIALCEMLASIIGPILDAKRQAQRPLPVILRGAVRRQLTKLFGPANLGLKASAVAVAIVLGMSSLVDGDYRVDASARLEGTVQRVVVAPFQGFVAEAPVRAGDIVEQGQLLCRLDDRDLQLERAKWSSERAQLLKAQRGALASHDRSEISILKTRLEQADAEMALVEEKLARTRLTAPLSGIVVNGDLSQSLGVPVERGQVLFEVAPLDSYRIMLEVDERDVAHVQAGQQGNMVLSGLPHEQHAFTVERVLPVSAAREGKTVFRVEGSLGEHAEQLRPGMRGVARIDAGRRKLVWIMTHKLVDWTRLAVWKWAG
ncbi:MAG: HlyD family efflux transporter periplasmic adaptor subunit [Thiogranum sp.]|nr:HlyD family efflux transporter periplasmic adaptor subunit [Thiogranum sp.]